MYDGSGPSNVITVNRQVVLFVRKSRLGSTEKSKAALAANQLKRRNERLVMTSRNRVLLLQVHLAAGLLLVCPASAGAQTVVATIPVGGLPGAVAANPVTNKIYVPNTVIDGATNSTTTIPAGVRPDAVAVNIVTNKIYVANGGNASPFGGGDPGSITVIDGATDSTTTVTDPNANGPRALAVNEVTNKVYVANFWSGNVTVIDGATNSTTTVTDPNANGLAVFALAVNQVTNKIYVLNNNTDRVGSSPGSVTVIDGATNSTTTVTDPNAISPVDVAVNPVTNKIYVANMGKFSGSNHGNITVIDGATNSTTTVNDPVAFGAGIDSRGFAVAVNSVTNKIYVANEGGTLLQENGGVTVIDGATNSIVNVTDPNAIGPVAVAVDPATNKIYVANVGDLVFSGCCNPGSVTVIDGAANSLITLIDPNAGAPFAVAVDPATSMVYVANELSGNVTVINEGIVPPNFTLSVISAGNGSGTVTSNPAGVNCPTSCSASFPTGSSVTLTASSDSGYVFSGWSGPCSGTSACGITMNGAEFVTATFNTPPPPDFSLTPASTTLTVQSGGQGSDVMSIAGINGPFGSAIQLTCAIITGPAPLPTCALSPASVTPGANSATSTLTITAPAAAAVLSPANNRRLSKSVYTLWLPLMFGVTVVGGSKKLRRRSWVLGGLLLLFVVLQTACGGGSPSNGIVQQPTNYTVSVTGASGVITHTTQVTVTVR
jgi:DNA-binding beta-propeller fold protein YncE